MQCSMSIEAQKSRKFSSWMLAGIIDLHEKLFAHSVFIIRNKNDPGVDPNIVDRSRASF